MLRGHIAFAPAAGFSVHREDWSLHRQGQLDQQRHREKVKEAIRANLADLVAEESIITSDGQRVVKVPIRSLNEYRFRYDWRQGQRAGQGDGNTKVGDVVAREDGTGSAGPGRGPGAGDQPGWDYYEAELTVDEVAELLFAELGLPHLDAKRRDEVAADDARWDDIRRHGVAPNLDRRRTLREALRRQAASGAPSGGALRLSPEDLRYRTWSESPRPRTAAVVLAMMDTSGSMGRFQKYMARSFFFWVVRFLRTKYPDVRIVFIAHDVQAREVSEADFFRKGESGGTRCSSAYRLALDIIAERFPPAHYNLYPFHFSDGDNLPSDNDACVRLVGELLKVSQQFCYAEVSSGYVGETTLWRAFHPIEHERFQRARITDKDELLPALRQFFREVAA